MEFERGVEFLRQQRPILGCPLNNLAQEMKPPAVAFQAELVLQRPDDRLDPLAQPVREVPGLAARASK